MKKTMQSFSNRELKTDELFHFYGGKSIPSPKVPDGEDMVRSLLGDWYIPEVDHLL
jgi:hypothetical protein